MKNTVILSSLILFAFATGICTAEYSGGDGSPENPYRISDANDMNDRFSNPYWDKHFVMVNDVNLAQFTGTEFNIIGRFTGVFDGNGFAISNFNYESSSFRFGIGLFRFVDDPNADRSQGFFEKIIKFFYLDI